MKLPNDLNSLLLSFQDGDTHWLQNDYFVALI